MPTFCMKRTLSAMPPTFAGVTRLTNDDAAEAPTLATNGRWPGTPPCWPIAEATYVSSDMTTHTASQPKFARTQGGEAVADVGELREQEVERADADRDQHQGPRADPDEALQRRRLPRP